MPTARVTGGWGTMVQLPVGGAGVGGTGVTDVVQPSSVSVTVGVRAAVVIVILQSGAVKLLPWIRYRPVGSARTSATLVVDGVPRTLTVDQFISNWVTHQIEVIQRRTRFRLERGRAARPRASAAWSRRSTRSTR